MTKEEFNNVKKGDKLVTGKDHYIVVDDIIGNNIVYFEGGYYHETLFDECDVVTDGETNTFTVDLPHDIVVELDKMEHLNEIDDMICERFHLLPRERQESIVNYIIELGTIDKDGKIESKYDRLLCLVDKYATKYGKEVMQMSTRFEKEMSILDDMYVVGSAYGHIEVYKNHREVTPHNIVEEEYKIYNSKDELIVCTNSMYTFNDILIQIMKKQLNGYYVIKNDGTKHNIDDDGHVHGNEFHYYPIFDEQLRELCGF